MALVPCPACGLPRAAADADTACPACRWADPPPPAPPPAPPAPVPAPAPVPDRPRGPLWLAGAAGLAVGAVVTFLLTRPDPPVAPTEPEVVAAPNPYPRVVALPVAPPPRPVEPDDDDPLVLPVPVPVPVAPDGGFAVLKLDQPDDPFHLPKLGAGNRVRLTGRVKKLYVEGLDGGAELDATGLANDGLFVTGFLDGGAVLRARTDGPTVSFKVGVRGGAVAEIDAPKAAAAFATYAPKTSPAVGGGSRVTLRAKSVSVALPVTGAGTVLDVTFTRGGSLKLAAVEDGALVRYRPEHRADPAVKVTPGRVAGGEVREEPPP